MHLGAKHIFEQQTFLIAVELWTPINQIVAPRIESVTPADSEPS